MVQNIAEAKLLDSEKNFAEKFDHLGRVQQR